MSAEKAGTAGDWWSWAKGCGCVALALFTVSALIAGWVMTTRPLEEAIEARERLVERYGPQEGFTPPADGAVPAERMEAFLSVRERLAEPCARITESFAAIEYAEQFEWAEYPPKQRPFASLWEGARNALSLETRRGEHFRTRNEALIDAEMGLGEYTYIFVIGYAPHLVSTREVEGLSVVDDVKILSRVRRLLLETLRRQLAAIETGSPGDDRSAWAEELAAEIARLEDDPDRIPWMQGLPAQIEASVSPYRERLDALLCEAAFNLELIRNEKQGLSIHGH